MFIFGVYFYVPKHRSSDAFPGSEFFFFLVNGRGFNPDNNFAATDAPTKV